MKLVVFGASGGVGRHVVEQSIGEGFTVTAFVRSKEKIAEFSDRIRVIEGDVMNFGDVLKAVEDQDVVVCTLGAPLQSVAGVRTKGTAKIIDAMCSTKTKRLVCLSAIGSGDSNSIIPFHYRAIVAPLLMRRLFKDHNGQERLVEKSDLDWMIVRPGNFTDGDHTGRYRHGLSEHAPIERLKFKISRADVADFIIQQIAKPSYSRRAAWLSY